ncbi:MAG: DUF4998 domain-containing protein [Draconibacterium sp.]
MDNKMKNIIYLFLVILTIGCFSSCKDMDSVYEEFVVPGGLKYPQKPDSLKVYAGYNKLRLTWLKAKDPSIVQAEIYWNNYHDTLKVDIPESQDVVVVDVDNLNEGTYTFHVKTYDKQGNASIPSEITGTSYGDNFVLSATDRTIASALRDDANNGTITWNAKTTFLVYSEVRYETSSGQKKTLRLFPEEKILKCPDIKVGAFFEYRSVFLPPNGIDSVARGWLTYEKPFIYKFPRTSWTAEARNGNHPWGDGGGGQPALVLDGDLSTGWHSAVGTPLPQCVVVDMKESLVLDNIIIYPPGPVHWRYIDNVEIYLRDEMITPDAPQPSWGEPVASAKYPGGDSFPISFLTAVKGQYMAIVFVNSKAAPNSYMSFMELEVFGY